MDTLGFAKVVRRWTPTWPSRKRSYFDFSPWQGGFLKTGNGPGAIVLHDDVLADIQTGRVYRDPRFS